MDRPNPVPLYPVVVGLPSQVNGSKACFWNSSLIPSPVSLHTNSYRACVSSLDNSVQYNVTEPLSRLYLMALLAMFINRRFKYSPLPTKLRWMILLISFPPKNCMLCCSQFVSVIAMILLRMSIRLNGLFSKTSVPDSTLFISRISLINDNK